MEYLLSYLFYCWVFVIYMVLESIDGQFPYRFDWTYGYDRCRPESYADYVEFREQQRY